MHLCKSTACNCHQVGAYGSSCSKFGGQCQCKPNVIGRCCDSCTPLTYGLGPDGCSRKPYYHIQRWHDITKLLKKNIFETIWNMNTNRMFLEHGPCFVNWILYLGHSYLSLTPLACDCDLSGSTAELCDQTTGQCSCREGVTARRCDKCYPGYYGFPLCRHCQCNGLADICDLVTGDCLACREHSTGPHCERQERIWYHIFSVTLQ